MQISCPFQLFKDAELWCGSALCWMLENDTYFGVMSCSLTYCNSFVPTTSRYCRYCLLCPSLTRSSCSQTCLSGEHAAFLPTLLPMWDVTLRLDNSACWINGDEESSVCFIYLVISGLVLCFFFFLILHLIFLFSYEWSWNVHMVDTILMEVITLACLTRTSKWKEWFCLLKSPHL